MDRHPLAETPPSAPLVSKRDLAIVAAFVPGLVNTVLFQLARLPFGSGRTLSLYAIYREGGWTFDVAARLDAGGDDGPLEDVLQRFARSDDCLGRILEPLSARVAACFRR